MYDCIRVLISHSPQAKPIDLSGPDKATYVSVMGYRNAFLYDKFYLGWDNTKVSSYPSVIQDEKRHTKEGYARNFNDTLKSPPGSLFWVASAKAEKAMGREGSADLPDDSIKNRRGNVKLVKDPQDAGANFLEGQDYRYLKFAVFESDSDSC